jgi:hypothetical protein
MICRNAVTGGRTVVTNEKRTVSFSQQMCADILQVMRGCISRCREARRSRAVCCQFADSGV